MPTEKFTEVYTPIWNYTASGINWVFKNENWKEPRTSDIGELLKVSEGIKLNLLVSIASVIEGSLKSYLSLKLQKMLNTKKYLEQQIDEYERNHTIINDDDNSSELEDHIEEEIFFGSSINEVKDEIKEKEKKLTDIINAFPKKGNLLTKLILLGEKIWNEILYFFKITKEIKPKEEQRILEIIELINKSGWNSLVNHHNKINSARISKILKEKKENLHLDVEKIFQFRNFIAHSNNIELEFNRRATEVNFKGKAKNLIKYITDKNFHQGSIRGKYFIEILIPDGLILHFKECLDLYLDCGLFEENFDTINLKKQIWA